MCSHSKIGLPAICLYLSWFTQGKGFLKSSYSSELMFDRQGCPQNWLPLGVLK